jgi:hypothetical protein
LPALRAPHLSGTALHRTIVLMLPEPVRESLAAVTGHEALEALASGGLLYGRRLQGALGATTSLVEVPHGPGQSGVAFAELGTLNVGGDFNFTVTDPARLT